MNLLTTVTCSTYLAVIFLLSACASSIPVEIREFPEAAPTVAEVRKQAESFLSQKVRWGGAIIQTENKHEASRLTIVALPLTDDGKPKDSDQSPGRFIAVVKDFLDPEIFSQGRSITVIGNVQKTETVNIGEFPYEYPVVQVEHYYLWPPEPEPSSIDPPPYWWHDPWYDPWYGPWYPWYSHPYYYPRHHHRVP